MRCPVCGRTVDEAANFCPFCGLHLASLRPDAGAQAPPRAPRPTREFDVELRRCPDCGAPNGPFRVLCVRCGVELEGERAGAPAAADSERSRRRVVVVAVLVLVAAFVAAALTLAGIGPLAQRDAAGPVFDPDRYRGAPGAIAVAGVRATSALAPNDRYGGALVADGDPRTAWNEGADGLGEDETLTLRLTDPAWITALVVRNGDQRDEDSFFANGRAARIAIRIGADGPSFDVRLRDVREPQVIELPGPLYADTVVVRVLEGTAGDRHEDLGISEIALRGWPAEG